jgi:hypothetical protein
LNGDFSTLTADLWFSRTWNRYTGNMLKETNLDKNKKDLFSELAKYKAKKLLHGYTKTEIKKDPNKFNEWIVAVAKNYADGGYKDKHPVNVKANTIFKKLGGEMSDIPRNGSERKAMRNAVNMLQGKLVDRGYPTLDIADLQAILWYNEKDLFALYKAVNEKSEKTDYERASQKVLKSRGVENSIHPSFQRGVERAVDTGADSSDQQYEGTNGKISEPVRFSLAPPTDSKAFKEWSGGGEIIEHGEISDYKFTEGEPVVMKLYHGTTHADKLFEFRGEELGSKEGYFGAMNYFTSSKHDAETNYLSEGADLTNRIQRRAEEIASQLEYDSYIDGISEEEARLIEDGDADVIQEVSERLASEDLKGSQDKVLELYVRVDNPLVFGGQHENWIDAFDVEVSEEAKAEAREEIIDEYGLDEDEASDYEGEILGRAIENEGLENKILEAVNEVIEEYDIDEYQADNLRALDLEYGEFTGQQLMNLFRDELADVQDMDTGQLIGTHIFSQIVKKLGFDSIILNRADAEFGSRGRRAVMGGVAFAGGGMEMEYDTTHVHIFDKDNAKIKSATENVGTFDPANADIRYSLDIAKDSKLDYKTSEGTLPDGRGFTDIEQFYDGELSRRIRLIVEDGNILPETAMYVRGEWWTDKKTLASFNLPLNPVDNVKGSGTDLYLRAMELVKENGGSWESDTDMQPEVIDLYERLMDFGLPIERLDVDDETSFLISQEDMQEIDFKEVRKNLNEVYSGKGGIRYSLENTVADIRFSLDRRHKEIAGLSNDLTVADIKSRFPDFWTNQEEEAIDKTQVTNTKNTMEYIINNNDLISNIPNSNALDVSAGLGLNAQVMKESGLNVETTEPNPTQGRERYGFEPTYSFSSEIEGHDKYGLITNTAVLNVLPVDVRNGVVQDIGRLLSVDGIAVITTRDKGFIKDVLKNKSNTDLGDSQVYFGDKNEYQKAFTAKEFTEYISNVLNNTFGEGVFDIEVGNLKNNKGKKISPPHTVIKKIKSTGGIRFSLDPLPQERKLAVIALADRMLKGNLTDQKADEIMQAFGIEDREAVMADAQLVIDDMDDDIKKATNKNTLKKAIRTKANQLEYRQRLRDIQMSAREGGEIYERARQAIAKRKKLAREMDIQDLDEATISNIIGDFRSSILEDEPNTTGMDMVSEAIRRKMVANGLISDRNKVGFKKMPEYRSTLARILKDVTIDLIGDLKAGTRKQQLKQQARALTGFTTTPAVENNFNKLMEKINDSIIRKTQKELRDDFNKTLKPFKKKPKLEEVRKQSVYGQQHLFLYYANEFKKLGEYTINGVSGNSYNEKLSEILSEIEKYEDSDKATDQIKFNDLEIQHNALVAFGGIDRSDAKLSDIDDAIRYANEVIADGKAIVERLDQAHREKYKAISDNYLNAIEQAKPYVKKDDRSKILDQMSQMHVRGQIESITAYGTPGQKASIETVLLANDVAKVKKMEMIDEISKTLIEEAKGIDIPDLIKYQKEISKEKESLRKYSKEERTAMSMADMMTIYMAFRQPDIVEKALRTNDSGQYINPDMKRRYDMKDEIAKEIGAKNIALAELMGDILERLLPKVNETYRMQYGIDMKVQPVYYFPLKVQVKKGGFKMYMSGISSAPSFTIARTHHTNDLDERSNIFEVFSAHVEDASHYVTTYESSMGIRSVMTNRFAREAIRQTFGDPTLQDVDDSIVDMVADRPVQTEKNVKVVDVARSWMSNISIGLNVKSILVAFTGTVNAFAVRKGMISAVTSAMRNPGQAWQDIKFIKDSIVVRDRKEYGINEGMRQARERSKGGDFEWYTERAYLGIIKVDEYVGSIIGGVVYNQYKNSAQAQGLTPEQVEANGLAVVNRFIQESYQPTSNDFMPADIRRGGSITKALFQFLTEPKSKLGIYFKDIKLAKAKYKQGDKVGATKDMIRIAIGQHILIPTAYWFAGEMMRAITGEDDDYALNRLMAGILIGPASGIIVLGTGIEIMFKIATGDKVFYGSSIPSDRIMHEVGFIINTTASEDEILEKVDDVLERYIPVYKHTKKAIN